MRGLSLALPAFVAYVGAVNSLNAGPQYFAFYDDDPATTAAFTNLRKSVTFTESVEAKKMGLDSLVDVGVFLWDGSRGGLREDWRKQWVGAASIARELLKNGEEIESPSPPSPIKDSRA